jgi:hypothetical protein
MLILEPHTDACVGVAVRNAPPLIRVSDRVSVDARSARRI